MRIAIIEHDRTIAAQLVDALSGDGHSCQSFEEAGTFLHSLPGEDFDACIVDHQLPGVENRYLLRKIRETNRPVPVLVLGGVRSPSPDVVIAATRGALEAGASGVVYGRNVWQADDPSAIASELRTIIHSGPDA